MSKIGRLAGKVKDAASDALHPERVAREAREKERRAINIAERALAELPQEGRRRAIAYLDDLFKET